MSSQENTKFVNIDPGYVIEYFSDDVAETVLQFPDTLAARYLFLTQRTPDRELEVARTRMKEVRHEDP